MLRLSKSLPTTCCNNWDEASRDLKAPPGLDFSDFNQRRKEFKFVCFLLIHEIAHPPDALTKRSQKTPLMYKQHLMPLHAPGSFTVHD